MKNSNIEKISWEHNEHPDDPKTIDWFWIVGIIAFGAIILSVYFKNFLFAIVLSLFIIIYFVLVNKPPRILLFEITRKGIRAGATLYPYSILSSFWVEDNEYGDKILLKTKKPLSPLILIPFDSFEIDPELLRNYLLDYLDEEELDEPLHQIIMERLGF